MPINSIKYASDLNFSQKLEKHLDDLKKNRANLSKDVPGELRQRTQQTDQVFLSKNIDAFISYGTYSTMLGYDHKARYLNGVNLSAVTLNAIV